MKNILTITATLFLYLNAYSMPDERAAEYVETIEINQILGHFLSQQDWAAEVGTDALIRLGAD